MLKYKHIHFTEVFKDIKEDFLSLFPDSLEGYLNSREDVLENMDIFSENCRSISLEKKDKSFNLFKKVKKVSSGTVVVIGFYLELFMYKGRPDLIIKTLGHYSNLYKDNIVIAYYNHDVDFASLNHLVEDFSNLKILNFNTSKKSHQDILLHPFSINQNYIKKEKKYRYGFIGNITHPLRNYLVNSFHGCGDFFHISGLNYTHYLETLSEISYNFCPRGAGLSSYRFYECFHLNTIPVLFSDKIPLPYADLVDYDKISIRLSMEDALSQRRVKSSCSLLDEEKTQEHIRSVSHFFTFKGVQTYLYNEFKNIT
jgi:hypothetical protein